MERDLRDEYRESAQSGLAAAVKERESEMAQALSENQVMLDTLAKGISSLKSNLEAVLVTAPEIDGDKDEDTRFMTVRARQIEQKTNQLRYLSKLIENINRTIHV